MGEDFPHNKKFHFPFSVILLVSTCGRLEIFSSPFSPKNVPPRLRGEEGGGNLQESFAAVGRASQALESLSRDAARQIVVIPGQLGSGHNVLGREERDPRQPWVMRVHEHALHEHVGRARMIVVPADIAVPLAVHHVRVLFVVALVAIVQRQLGAVLPAAVVGSPRPQRHVERGRRRRWRRRVVAAAVVGIVRRCGNAPEKQKNNDL